MALALLIPTLSKAQWYESLRDVGPPTTWQRTQHYVRNTGTGGVPLRLMWEVRDTAMFKIWSDSLIVNYLGTSNHGYPSGNLLWTDAIGTVRGTPLSSMFFTDSTVVATRSWVGTQGYLTAETDPLFDTKFSTKSTSDLAEGTNLYYTDARARSALSAGTGISYSSGSGVITNSAPDQTVVISSGTGISVTGAYPSFTVTNTAPAQSLSFSTPTRSLSTNGTNNTFTVSASRPSIVYYTINFSAALVLTTSNGAVDLDYSLNGGSTWVPVSTVSQVFGTSITINTSQQLVLSGVIPANALVRINRVSNTNVTISITKQQEVVM